MQRIAAAGSIRRWVIIAVLCSTCLALVPVASAQQAPSQMLNQYRNQRITWMTNVWPYANNLFFWLALIEFTWSAAVMALEKSDLQSWAAALIRKVMWIGAFYALLINGRNWIPTIVDSFNILGQQASGSGPMSPSDIFIRGLNIAGALMDGASSSAFLKNPGTSLACVAAAALTVLAFIGVTIQFVVAMVESYIIVAAGVIFLGFGGSRWTAPYVERYIGLGVSNGVKIMLLYLLVGVGMNISIQWIPDAQAVANSATPAMDAFEVMGAALIFLMLCWQVPKLFAAVLGGAPALAGGDLLSTGTGVVAGAATVGTIAAGGAALATRAAAALDGVSTAAGAGGSGSAASSIASVGAARNSGGAAGGGTVPPPSSPFSRPPSNGHPRQPNPPPFTRDSAGASSELTGTCEGSSPQRRNSGGSNGNGNGRRENSARSVLSAIGGENLAGSGFENERPASGFIAVSAPLRTNRPASPAPISSAAAPNSDRPGEKAPSPPSHVTGFSTHNGGSGPSPDHGGQNSNRQPGAQSLRSAKSEADQAPNPGTADRQPPSQDGRENPGSRARNADQVLSGAANRLRGIRNQLGGLPSDAAPHATPPRMPIDHHE